MKDFRRLTVWDRAHRLTLQIYRATATFPRQEIYGLASQMRRCSASIPSNIAEGCGRHGNAEFHRFLQIAMGSASELDYQLLLARDLKYLSDADHQAIFGLLLEVQRMLMSLLQKVQSDRSAK